MSSATVLRTSRSKATGASSSSSISSSIMASPSSSSGGGGGGGTRRRRRRTGRRSTKRSIISPRRRRMVSVTARPFSRGRSWKTPPVMSRLWVGGGLPCGRDTALTMHLNNCCVGTPPPRDLSESASTGSENLSRKASNQSQSQGRLSTVAGGSGRRSGLFLAEVLLMM
ncbi:hypothetical protein [Human adenovirus 6]|uniref:Uncharacterized protein n=1 Tax=Human adenovirus C serotype 6 TaxID=10534 RepID=A0A0U5CNA0_ADE06|nr:hypothetical protein [Human adenovirus 6]